jgi:hypothetical protein
MGTSFVSGLAGGLTARALTRGDRSSYTSVFASALGNAMGDGIVGAMQSNPASAYDYRNGSDIDSDNYNPATNYNHRNGLDVDSDNFNPAMAYGYRNGMDVESDSFSPASAYGYRNGLDVDSDAFNPAGAYGYRNSFDVASDAASRVSARRAAAARDRQWIAQDDAIMARRAAEVGAGDMRVGPTIERARALGIYSGDSATPVQGRSPGAYISAITGDGLSAAERYLRNSGAYARNAGTIEAQVGPAVGPVVALTLGGPTALVVRGGFAAAGAYDLGYGGAAIADGNYLDGAGRVGAGLLSLAGAATPVRGAAPGLGRAGIGAADATSPLGRVVSSHTAVSPGTLDPGVAGTFAGGRYSVVQLADDTVLYRAGTANKPLGQFFDTTPPQGVLQTRIDKAVLPVWPGGGTSPIDTAFAVSIPKGTTVYVGEVGSQGGFYVGGTQQVVVLKPWAVDGVQVIGSTPLR